MLAVFSAVGDRFSYAGKEENICSIMEKMIYYIEACFFYVCACSPTSEQLSVVEMHECLYLTVRGDSLRT